MRQKRRVRAAASTGRGAQVGGRSSARAMSTLFTTLVLIPFPRPSTCTAPRRVRTAGHDGWALRTERAARGPVSTELVQQGHEKKLCLREQRARTRRGPAPASAAAHLRNQLGHLVTVERIAGVVCADILHRCCRLCGAACAASGAGRRRSEWTCAGAAEPLGPQTESCLDRSIFGASKTGMNRVLFACGW